MLGSSFDRRNRYGDRGKTRRRRPPAPREIPGGNRKFHRGSCKHQLAEKWLRVVFARSATLVEIAAGHPSGGVGLACRRARANASERRAMRFDTRQRRIRFDGKVVSPRAFASCGMEADIGEGRRCSVAKGAGAAVGRKPGLDRGKTKLDPVPVPGVLRVLAQRRACRSNISAPAGCSADECRTRSPAR